MASPDFELNDWGWFIDIEEEVAQKPASSHHKFKTTRYIAVLKTITETHSFNAVDSIENFKRENDTENDTSIGIGINFKSYCLMAVAGFYCFAFLTI